MKAMIEAGAAGVHFEDQLASEKKCGHLGGKVLVPISQHIRTLNAARLAADVEGVPTVLLCRTDAQSAQLLTSDIDERDRPFISGERTAEGFFRIRQGLGVEYAIARSLAYAPYADLLWWETSEPDLGDAERFADAIHREFPDKMLAYNCSPSFNWRKKLAPERLASFQRDIAQMGYRFNSSRWLAFTASISRCSNWREITASAAWRHIPSCSRRSSQRRPMGTPQLGISARLASATSMR
jgi:isocitrate lyase